MIIELLGDNCKTCCMLRKNIESAIKTESSLIQFVENSDPERFVEYGIRALPGVAIDGVLKSQGRLLSQQEIAALISGS